MEEKQYTPYEALEMLLLDRIMVDNKAIKHAYIQGVVDRIGQDHQLDTSKLHDSLIDVADAIQELQASKTIQDQSLLALYEVADMLQERAVQ